jgi:hypothetical protein
VVGLAVVGLLVEVGGEVLCTNVGASVGTRDEGGVVLKKVGDSVGLRVERVGANDGNFEGKPLELAAVGILVADGAKVVGAFER